MTNPHQATSDALSQALKIMQTHAPQLAPNKAGFMTITPVATPSEMEPSDLLDDKLKDQVLEEFQEALQSTEGSKLAGGTANLVEDKAGADVRKAIEDKDRDTLINRILGLIFKNPSPATRSRICGDDYANRRADDAFWIDVASTALSGLGLLAGIIAVAALPATIAAVALVLAKYGQEHICTVKMPQT
ncbi:hypothetical protein [Deinococcus ruber]|uniref:Uncharacterized protein n=1 Tax=Deinococcus ruber TaxID=1848197 RepID=A0A918F608_9DEIO|nr:hypothetical protein [Deinococcus ruber]GGR11507.1 hypothetical protein GCM10008957_25480 [Deinococcus ruber]